MLAFLMRYGHQQKSELESWPIDEVVRFYNQVRDIVKREGIPDPS